MSATIATETLNGGSLERVVSWQPSNREKVFVTKKGKFWCDHCDAAKLGDGEKCPNCGKRNRRRRLKNYHAAS